jgi:hypothetical protein
MANLSMTVQRLGMDTSVPPERRGCMVARIEISDDTRGNFIELIGESDGFEPSAVATMLTHFGDLISRKWPV